MFTGLLNVVLFCKIFSWYLTRLFGLTRTSIFKNSTTSSHPLTSQEVLWRTLQGSVYRKDALCWKSTWTQTCWQLPGRQWRTTHVCSVRRELGCVWGDLLGLWLWGQGFTWCVYQSLSLCTLDKKCHQIVILHGNFKRKCWKVFNLHY